MAVLYLRGEDGAFYPVQTIQGEPGLAPHIGANGNWWIGETDTGVPARGEGSGDMLVSTYDADGSVAAAGGIKQYVAAHGGSSEGGSTDLTGYAKEDWVKEQLPKNLSDLNEDAAHRTVTDEEKNAWSGKSNFSGSYNDLTDKPDLFSGKYEDLTGKPTLFSGSYNDLTEKPTIPNGDMMASAYDPYGTVAAAGGIVDYVAAHAGGADQTVVEGTGTATATSSTHTVLNTSTVTWKKVGHICFVKCDLEISPASNGYQYYTINLTGLPISQEGIMIGKVNYCVASYTRNPTEEQLTTNGAGLTLMLGFDTTITSNLQLEYSIIGYAE